MKLLLWISAALALAPAGGRVGTFTAQVRTVHTTASGLPDNDVLAVAATSDDAVYAATAKGLARFAGGKWSAAPAPAGAPLSTLVSRGAELFVVSNGALHRLVQGRLSREEALPAGVGEVRQVAFGRNGEIAIAAASGLHLRDGSGAWRALYPRDGGRSWAPHDVRGVAFDSRGRLWFASPQGAGCLDGGRWTLYTGEDGLPYHDFTGVAASSDGAVWFGTRIGAIRYDGKTWEYRQGPRWIPDDHVRGVAVTRAGDAWFATSKGVGAIERRPATLREKAKFFEDEIDRRHRRTEYGYVLSVSLKRPGDKSEWVQRDSDNDGLWTSMYGAGQCFAYAATRDPAAKKRARAAFEALRFLGAVTQGGEPPAPPGFVARTVLPASGPNPNLAQYTKERDEQIRATRDRLWKVLSPRWPKSADGKWYWKADTSSDELDGHYFFYAQYYDLAAETAQEKEDARRVVRAITDHLIEHDFNLVDWDGKPTRWAVFSPSRLNSDPTWWPERGLNSLSILSYLKVAEHITGDARYARALEGLIRDHHYGQNVMAPKIQAGPGTGNQSDDEMAMMSFYDLLKYEAEPRRRSMWALALFQYCRLERPEMNPLFNFICAASLSGKSYSSPFRVLDLSLEGEWLDDAVDTLKRIPMDRVDWPHRNSHRKDLVPVGALAGDDDGGPRRGLRRNGKVLPADERYFEYWNHDPYRLDTGGRGLVLADGAAFLLPYYLGLYHGFIEE